MKLYCAKLLRVIFFVMTLGLISCHEEIDVVYLSSSEIVTIDKNKISSDKTSLLETDAIIVAEVYANSNVATKSFGNKKIKDVVTVTDTNGNPGIYAVNFDDGYILISATKSYYPILAEVDHGSFSLSSGTGQDIIVNEMLKDIEYLKDHPEQSINRQLWLPYENQRTLARTSVNDDYYDMLQDTYMPDWYADGRNVYYLYDKPDNMPDDIYEYFCELASDGMPEVEGYPYMQCAIITEKYTELMVEVPPMLCTNWDQTGSFNDSDTQGRALGCLTVAVAQLMRYYEYPTDIAWDAMPNNTSNSTLCDFLYDLRMDLNIDDSGMGYLSRGESYFIENGYNCTRINHDKSRVSSCLTGGNPVFMYGWDDNISGGHFWICDGYKYIHPYTEYTLYLPKFYNRELGAMEEFQSEVVYESVLNPSRFHMNWGWGGLYNGFYLGDNVRTQRTNDVVDFSSNRKDLLISVS